MDNNFAISKHEKYFNRFLSGLPASAASEDSNKLSIIYFCLHGLQLLDKFQFSESELKYHSDFIYNEFLIENEDFIAFRATNYFKSSGSFDLPNLSATLFALYNLLILKSNYSKRLNQDKIMKFLKLCQVKTGDSKGGFVSTLARNEQGDYEQFGDSDVRTCYMALAIRRLVKYDEFEGREHDIDTKAALEFILERCDSNGGFSSQVLDEPHLGYTFCAVACLKLLDYPLENLESTKNWLLQRQVDYPSELYKDLDYEYYRPIDIGGFNGRENKLSDTCYCWWCTGALYIMDKSNLNFINLNRAEEFLLHRVQNQLYGGFGKDIESTPDPFHSYLAISSLALWNAKKFGLKEINPVLVITQESYNYFKSEIEY
ncbi:Geranylgeranyl transferase type-1 subunit beta [Spathaspora sp. JA1]|nr:Geranylgeranyl transferase type-1 subunit beta [Spathaspora sp. JA1]